MTTWRTSLLDAGRVRATIEATCTGRPIGLGGVAASDGVADGDGMAVGDGVADGDGAVIPAAAVDVCNNGTAAVSASNCFTSRAVGLAPGTQSEVDASRLSANASA